MSSVTVTQNKLTRTRRDRPGHVCPSAIIVGPMKAGTSWLYEYFAMHQEVIVPSGTKETFYFDQRFNTKSTQWYLSHFRRSEKPHARTAIEVAPTYFECAEAPGRIQQTLGDVKIIVTLRDPAERAFSLYQHMRRYGFTDCKTFRDAVKQHDNILASSRYSECIARWQSVFGVQQVHVLLMEDLRRDPNVFASQCCAALEVDASVAGEDFPTRVNVATEPTNYYVAKLGRLAGDVLRSFRLYPLVTMAKQAGLKRLFFGKPQTEGQRRSLCEQDREWFIQQIADDLQLLKTSIEQDITSWFQIGSSKDG